MMLQLTRPTSKVLLILLLLVLLVSAVGVVVSPDTAEAHDSSYRGHACDGVVNTTCYLGNHSHRVWISKDDGGGYWKTVHHHSYGHVMWDLDIHYRNHVRAPWCAKKHPWSCGKAKMKLSMAALSWL
jgi:hypothetical protein